MDTEPASPEPASLEPARESARGLAPDPATDAGEGESSRAPSTEALTRLEEELAALESELAELESADGPGGFERSDG